MSLLNEGQIIRGTYEVERFLGEGAFAEVYRVKHRFLGRQAMKVFKLVGMTFDEIEQTLGEAELLSRIGHPNIIRVFDANIADTAQGACGFFTMEYVAGGTVEQFWQSHGMRFVPVETAVEIIRQVCRGLGVAHSEKPPIVHRDITPQNILVGYDPDGLRVRVSDFGLAKRANPLTLMVSGRGRRAFKAPEVFRDWQADSCAGDVWAVGSVLYLLLTDRLPHGDPGELDLLDGHAFERPLIPPSRVNLLVDSLLDQIVFRALAMNPAERYPSAKDMLSDLERWRPRSSAEVAQPKLSGSPGSSKSPIGERHSPLSKSKAETLAEQARLLAARERLAEAADLMEEAFNKWPDLRERYEYHVKLWRRGISK